MSVATVYASPNHGPKRARTLGVVVHSTRGGLPYGQEYRAAIAWLCNPASGVSAHAVIGREQGQIMVLLDTALEAWHCRELNVTHIGYELEQPTADDDYTSWQYVTLARLVKRDSERYGFPLGSVMGHDQTEPGKRDGKTDPGKMFSWNRFGGILAAL